MFIFINRIVETSYDNAILEIVIYKVFSNIKIFSLTVFNIKKDFLLLASFYNEWLNDLNNKDIKEDFFLKYK